MAGGIFHQFPYTNFHEMNLDWLLHENYITREKAEAAEAKAEAAAASTAELELSTDDSIFESIDAGAVSATGTKYGKLVTINLGITGAGSTTLFRGVLIEKYRPAQPYIQSGMLDYVSGAPINYTLRIATNGTLTLLQDDPLSAPRDRAFTLTYITE